MCSCFADCLYDSNRGVTGGEKRQVRVGEGTESEREMQERGESREGASRSERGKARTLAILSLGSLTAVAIAVGILLLFQTG